ncbi:MAG: hypothetical protein II844_01135 [Prevotella sp.]|nr:hypothetical protein [Prevotella sp.]
MNTNLNTLLAAMAFLACGTGAAAQGNMQGLGTNNENTQSLAERVLKLEKKHDAVSIYLNTHVSYQERFNGDDEGGSFVGRQLRFEMLGSIGEKWSYRLRYRLNRPGEQQDDNFSNNIDVMAVNYKATDRLTLSAGKLGCAFGGYQYDDNPIQVLEFCDWLTGIDGFHVGTHAAYEVAKDNTLVLGLYNNNNNRTDRYFADEPTLENARHPLAGTLYWAGSLFGGKVQTLWSYTLLNEVKNHYGSMVMLGTRLNLPKWQFTVDYYGAWEQIDHHRIVSGDMTAAMGKPVVARGTCYNTLLAEVRHQSTPHWNFILDGRIESASARHERAFRNYRTSYGYIAAVQWIPDLTQDARISLAYIGKTVDYNNLCGLSDYNRDRVELSLIYRIKAY